MKIFRLFFFMLALLAQLSSCSVAADFKSAVSASKSDADNSFNIDAADSWTQNNNGGTNDDLTSKKLNLDSFHAIKVNSKADITYHQGKGSSVTLRANAEALAITDIYVKNGTLIVDLKKIDGLYVRNSVKLYLDITCPAIDKITCNGAMTFVTQKMKAEAMNITNNGALETDFNQLECGAYNLKNNGALTAKGTVNAQDISITNNGALTMNGDCSAKGTLNITNSGSNKMVCTFKAASFTLNGYGADEDFITLNADNTSLELSGSSKLKGSIKGKKSDINCDGAAKIDMDVDLESLNVNANGSAKLTLRGTAENTKIESSGIAKVDATSLNKF